MAVNRRTRASDPTPSPGAREQLAGERELWTRFARGRDPAIREELVRRNLPFAKRLALRYRGASESFDDLLQVANLGLVNAVDRFDPERGIPFTAFASPTILGELKRHFRDRVWTVRVPRGLHDRMAEVEKAITELTKELQRSPSIGEIAARLDLEQTDVLEVLEASHNRRPLSLDRPAGAEDADETPAAERIGSEDTGFELVEGRIALDAALPYLDERERLVLRLRFADDMTQSQIAARIGHSQMHVSRILRRALSRIRERIDEERQGNAQAAGDKAGERGVSRPPPRSG
jgi:RNA polymerase sigma-B factor